MFTFFCYNTYSKKENDMGRSKGSNDKYWVAEDKYRIIKPTLGLDKSIYIITRETE